MIRLPSNVWVRLLIFTLDIWLAVRLVIFKPLTLMEEVTGTTPLMLLSGLMSPVSNMPRVLQLATYANPLRFGMDLVRRVYLEGAGMHEIAFDFVPMLAIAAVTLPLAAWLFRNRLA